MRKQFFESLAQKYNLQIKINLIFSNYILSGRLKGEKFKIYETINRSKIIIIHNHKIISNTPVKITLKENSFPLNAIAINDQKFSRDFNCFSLKRLYPITSLKNAYYRNFKNFYDNTDFLALLNSNVRQHLLLLKKNTDAILINNNKFQVGLNTSYDLLADKFYTDVTESVRKISKIINKILLLHAYLVNKINVKKRIIANFKNDPIQEFRLQCLDKLISHYMLDDEVDSAIVDALSDEYLLVQITAAKNLGEKGLKHLLKILKKPELLPDEQIYDLLIFLDANDKSISLKTLKLLLKHSRVDFVVAEILKMYQEKDDNGISSFLVEELKHKSSRIQRLLLDTIGTIGLIEDVESLKSLVRSYPENEKYFANAIVQIQTRYGIKPEKGWLTLSEVSESEGALSINEGAEQGALSVDDGE